MSILKDRIRPLDPTSLQEFLGDEELLRVALRDITSTDEAAMNSPLDSGRDAGLGTGL